MTKPKKTETEEEIIQRGSFDKGRGAELRRIFAEQKRTIIAFGVVFIAGLIMGALLARREPRKE